jgi:hypothetical protein
MKYLTLIVTLLLVVSPCYSFWSTGHMIIARIALEELQQKDPAYLAQVQKEVDVLGKFSQEDKHSFVESAVWADDNKGVGWTAFNNWHFVDTPVIDPQFHGETEFEAMNATFALYEMQKTLKNKNKPKFNSDLALSFAWRYLIHLVGDIHQPLHSASFYSPQFPNGDRGGNSFKVNYPGDKQITNLHALWDACVDQYGSVYAPVTETQYQSISKAAASLTSEYPRSKVADRVKILDGRIWADESNQIAEKYVYNGITSGSTPSNEYIVRGRNVINEQLAVAGYRLADLILSLRHNPNLSVAELLSK